MNDIAYPNKTSYIGGEYAAGEYNTWNLNLTATNADFISVDDPSMTVTGKPLEPLGGAFGPRKADGSLPDIDFLKLSPKSQFIDKGVNVKLPYEGKAPDLGAYEYKAYVEPVITSSSSSAINGSSSSSSSNSVKPASSSSSVNSGGSVESSSSMDDVLNSSASADADSTAAIRNRRLEQARAILRLRNSGRTFYVNGRVVRNRKGHHLFFAK